MDEAKEAREKGGGKDARAGDRATGEKESIGISLYGYANDGRR